MHALKENLQMTRQRFHSLKRKTPPSITEIVNVLLAIIV